MTILKRIPGRFASMTDLEATWIANNPRIYRGETCYTIDADGVVTGYKVGKVAWPVGSHWLDLEYGIVGPAGSAGPPDGYKGVWDSGTAYSTGDRVVDGDNHERTSLVDSNVGHDPTTDDGTYWTAVSGGSGASDAADVTFDPTGLAVVTATEVQTLGEQIDAALALRAPLASPAFTGHPTGFTESTSDSSTRLATTALVDAKITAAGKVASNAQTGISYTLVASDAGKSVDASNASAITITINNNVHAAGDTGEICQTGAGQITIAQGTGVTIHSLFGLTKTLGQYATVSWRAISASEFVISGELTT